jgi:putative oxidoreductase
MRVFRSMNAPPRNTDLGLLTLRVIVGGCLCVLHGWPRLSHYSQLVSHFPDPIHVGRTFSLLFAILSDFVSPLFIAMGLFTRPAAMIIALDTATAFGFVHRFALSGQHNGEFPLLFCAWALSILFAGPGRYSLDAAKDALHT